MSFTRVRSTASDGASLAVGPLTMRARPLALLLLLLLALQFLLGIVTNLYVQIPANHPGSGSANFFVNVLQGLGWAITQGTLALQFHALLGLGLIITGFIFIAVAYIKRQRVWMVCAPIAVFGMIGAGLNGASFVNSGHDFSSLLMSLGFLFALVSLLVGLYLTPRADQEPLKHAVGTSTD